MSPHLGLLDYLIIVSYFIFVIALGFFFNKKQKSEQDYFLAGRSLLWPVIGFSLFASNIGSISLVGLAEAGYKSGFAVFSYEWMATVVLIIFAVFFLPFYLKNKIFSFSKSESDIMNILTPQNMFYNKIKIKYFP